MSLILGIDPGLSEVGFGVIEKKGDDLKHLDCGIFKTSSKTPFAERLHEIKQDLEELFKAYSFDAVGIEELFFAKNVTNALKVAQARGVIVEATFTQGYPLYEFTPMQMKQNVCGYGGAGKEQVQEMVKTHLSLAEAPKPHDAADALAIAICTARVL